MKSDQIEWGRGITTRLISFPGQFQTKWIRIKSAASLLFYDIKIGMFLLGKKQASMRSNRCELLREVERAKTQTDSVSQEWLLEQDWLFSLRELWICLTSEGMCRFGRIYFHLSGVRVRVCYLRYKRSLVSLTDVASEKQRLTRKNRHSWSTALTCRSEEL